MLVKKSSTGEFRFFVDNFCNSSGNGSNAKELLDMLYQKDTVNDVQNVYNYFSDVYSVENVSIGEGLLG